MLHGRNNENILNMKRPLHFVSVPKRGYNRIFIGHYKGKTAAVDVSYWIKMG